MSYFISNKSSTLTIKTISQFYFDTSTTHCYNSIFQSSSILMRFLSQIFCAFKLAVISHLSQSMLVLSNSEVGHVWTISRFANLKGRELLHLTLMMEFLYGSYIKEEENFSLSKKMKERENNLWTTQMTKFYKKVRVFNRTMRIQWKRTSY